MSDIGFLFAGYGVIWVILGGYLYSIGRRQSALRRELQRLQREVERGL
ncbi:MAG: CcmD family protein [Thermoleophilia bacterium]|nr:CcmD family protein [Thermoleophilia bacterium]